MKIFAIADLHLSFQEKVTSENLLDVKMYKPMDVFGEDWEKHYLKIYNNWRKNVKEEDFVLIPGDISWALKIEEVVYDLEFIDNLPGTKILGKGNHDYWWSSMKKIDEMTSDKIKIIQNNCVEINEEIVVCGTRGWVCPNDTSFTEHDEKIYNRELLRLENSLKEAPKNKKIIVMLHYPPVNDKHEKSEFIDLMEEYSVHTCVYGHLHSYSTKIRIEGEHWGINFLLTSADFVNFTPREIIL